MFVSFLIKIWQHILYNLFIKETQTENDERVKEREREREGGLPF